MHLSIQKKKKKPSFAFGHAFVCTHFPLFIQINCQAQNKHSHNKIQTSEVDFFNVLIRPTRMESLSPVNKELFYLYDFLLSECWLKISSELSGEWKKLRRINSIHFLRENCCHVNKPLHHFFFQTVKRLSSVSSEHTHTKNVNWNFFNAAIKLDIFYFLERDIEN